MDQAFWQARWEAGEIGFHQQDINPHLQRYWPELQLPAGNRVFVPLCGKSRDMLWLAAQGHRVLGVEVSSLAVRAFFSENDLHVTLHRESGFVRHSAADIELLEGDFFRLRREHLEDCTAVYDRAALVALPAEMRVRYVETLAALLQPGTVMLLITFDYRQQEMEGPPFAVNAQEVQRLYASDFDISILAELDILAENPRFQERGLTALSETVYKITRR